jgi:hypothetical protein
MIKIMYVFLAIGLLLAAVSVFLIQSTVTPDSSTVIETPVEIMCTADALQCPDGTYVGRTGPNCSFVCPEGAPPLADTSDLIVLDSPVEKEVISNPLMLSGQARGGWFFEASFPVTLTNWDGLIIAEGPATAVGDWMTSEFVPFTMTLPFTNPYTPGDPDFMKRGTLILQKDNPSGLPENDNALEIQVQFAP